MPVKRVDAYKPVLLNSPALNVTLEQMNLIRRVLEVASSDTQFVNKSFNAIILILTAGITPVPEITSLDPTSAEVGTGAVTLRVLGKNFDPTCEVVWNGIARATTFVSPTEITALADLSTITQPMEVGVRVESSSGYITEPFMFSVVPVPAPPAVVVK